MAAFVDDAMDTDGNPISEQPKGAQEAYLAGLIDGLAMREYVARNMANPQDDTLSEITARYEALVAQLQPLVRWMAS